MKTKHLSLALILAYCCVVAVLARYEFWSGDDVEYLYKAEPGVYIGLGNTPVRTLGDLVESQINHYSSVNGRTPAHILVQIFCPFLGKKAFVVANFFVYLLFFYLLLRCCRLTLHNGRGVVLVVLLTAVSFSNHVGPTCQIGYTWVFCLALWWMLTVQKYRDRTAASRWGYVGLFTLAFFAGWGQEALNIGICFAILVYAATHFKQMHAPLWVLFVGFGLGTLMIVASPAAWARAFRNIDAPSPLTFRHLLFGLRCMWLFVLYMGYLLLTKRATLKQMYRLNAFFIHGIACLLVFNVVISIFNYRQLFGIELLALLAFMNLFKSYGVGRISYAVFAIALAVLTTFLTGRHLRQQLYTYYFNVNLYNILAQKPDNTYWNISINKTSVSKRKDYEESIARLIYFHTGKHVHLRIVSQKDETVK